MESETHLTSDDKIWAAIAHASVLFSFWGPVVPAILWFLQRRKSEHIRFHALQALAYQITSFWVGMILMPVLMIAAFAVMFGLIAYGESHINDPIAILGAMMPMLIYAPMIAVWGLYVLVGVVGAIASLTGRTFTYPIMGEPLRRKLGYEPTAETRISDEQEDQVVSAVSHATCIIPMFGAIVPLIVWISQKDRGGFIRFQSLQALVYQAIGTAAYFILWVLYVVFMFVMMGFTVLGANAMRAESAEGLAVMLAFLAPMMCIALVMFIGGPLFHLYGFIASLKVLRGGDYNYPLLGRYLRKRTETAATEATT
jgi:uncharacterized Tic20 family protein